MPDEHIKSQVRAVVNKVMLDRGGAISDRDNLFNLGIDSVAAMMLICELEEAFSLELSETSLSYEDFSTIDGITQTIESILAKDLVRTTGAHQD
jgi:acyl carrier protein